MDEEDEDIFDKLGPLLFETGGTWCVLKNIPCIPLPPCWDYIDQFGKCKYELNN